ncbi:MAG: ATP-dependent DNA helicase [Rariglobus sp.]|nr:helicase C-terminal domain-containing protein [Rariglobus sp.]
MNFDLDQRTATLSIGEFSAFNIGPRDPSDGTGAQGLWRARLGTRWHQELRAKASAATPATTFEVPITGRVFHGGWTLTLTGRIDQFLPAPDARTPAILREIKTTLDPLPAPEEDLRAAHPDYFAQLATYLALRRIDNPSEKIRGELVFVEAGSGLLQTIAFTHADEAPFQVQLERVAEFLNLRLRARERLRGLRFHSAFPELRDGQQTTQADLTAALASHRHVLFTAPTGFGKTGALLECALGAMKSGRYSRLLYLTSKATGQLQVLRTLRAMTAKPNGESSSETLVLEEAATHVATWHVRPKHEHCLDPVCYCQRREFNHPDSVAQRWKKHGLSRFYLFEDEARDIPALRSAGEAAQICPYEITRTALAFQDVWIGDYNYVFAPANRTLFYNQPGFAPSETLLIIDEAHNLPSRAADARSHTLYADNARRVLSEFDHIRAPAPLARAWEAFTLLLASLPVCDVLDLAQEDDLVHTVRQLADTLALHPLPYEDMEPPVRELLWQLPSWAEWFAQPFPKLIWSPRAGELRLTCLDAALPAGEILREFAGVIFATATPGPATTFAESCGLTATIDAPAVVSVTAHTPWRDDAYDITYDIRVDTTFSQRARHAGTTADTIAALHEASEKSSQLSALSSQLGHGKAVAVFFPSYAYAESIANTLRQRHPHLRAALQPRLSDLAAQTAWVDESLAFSDALFLVLGSSFAEGIDTLGGRISHAMVVGPALPEVNAVQRARLEALPNLTREAAFQRVYQIPGIQKVNQALGRLVRAPGQRAKVILHCRRFLEPAYASLLDRDYQFGQTLATDSDLSAWLSPKTD